MSQIGLPQDWRFAVFNNTGVSISTVPVGMPSISGRRVRFDSAGMLSYESVTVTFLSITQGSIAQASYVTGSTFSNTLSGWLGGDFLASAFASGNASGNLVFYLEESPDGGTTWPTAASANGAGGGLVVAVIGYGSVANVASTASTTRTQNFDL